MPGTITELNPVDTIRAAAIGQPGRRVFYLQGRGGDELVTLILEKAQLQSLAVAVEQLIEELQERFPELSEASAAYREPEMQLEQPIDPSSAWARSDWATIANSICSFSKPAS